MPRVPHARRERVTRPRPRTEPLDLFHAPPAAALHLGPPSTEPPPVRRRKARPARVELPPTHPRRVVAATAVLLIAVVVTSFVFWFVILQDDAARRAFFPLAESSAPLVPAALFGFAAQVAAPLYVLRRLQERGRLLIAWSLRLIVAWVATAILTGLVHSATEFVAPRLVFLAGMLAPASYVLYRLVRAAIAADAALSLDR
jgi:hypothetical protein